MHRLVFGCGYLGARVARRWLESGDRVSVVTRSQQRAAQFAADGYHPIVADVTRAESLAALSRAAPVDTLLYAVGYDRTAAPSIHEVYADGLRNVLDTLENVARVIYISTTGVYGPAGGGWVDESTPPTPQREGGRASLAAEQRLAESRHAASGVVLRLAGIYGPDRIPLLKPLRAGEPIAAPREGHLNLIHVDDAATVALAAADIENGSQLYCVSDGSPVVRADYYREVARRIGAPPPTFRDPPADSPRAARAAADKRVSNRRMLEELRVRLAAPSYREGLAAILGNAARSG